MIKYIAHIVLNISICIYIYIYGCKSKYKVWIKGPGPHAIHTPRSIPRSIPHCAIRSIPHDPYPQSSMIFHHSLLCFCSVILSLFPGSMVLLLWPRPGAWVWWPGGCLALLQELATAASDSSGLSRDLARSLFPLLDVAAFDNQIRLFDNQEGSRFSFHTPFPYRSIPVPYPKHAFATTSPCLT